MSKIDLTTTQLATLLGMKFRTVTDWAERGVIVCDVKSADGYRTKRRWGIVGLRRALLAKHMIQTLKIDRWRVKEILDSLDFTKPNDSVTIPTDFCQLTIDHFMVEREINLLKKKGLLT